jgi:hypothetical protein
MVCHRIEVAFPMITIMMKNALAARKTAIAESSTAARRQAAGSLSHVGHARVLDVLLTFSAGCARIEA